jgi:hypothetical protein
MKTVKASPHRATIVDDFVEEDFAEVMTREEELLPELQRYVLRMSPIPMIQHPLVITAFMTNAIVNYTYRQRLYITEKARAENDWVTFVLTHEHAYQIDVFSEVTENMNDAEYWALLGEIYTESENLRQSGPTLRKLLESKRPQRDKIMNGRERAYFQRLPSKFTIYRGYAHRNASGWSWTLDKAKAKWFARRYADLGGRIAGKPRLATGIAKKRDAIAYFSRRREREIVVDPRKVNVESREVL